MRYIEDDIDDSSSRGRLVHVRPKNRGGRSGLGTSRRRSASGNTWPFHVRLRPHIHSPFSWLITRVLPPSTFRLLESLIKADLLVTTSSPQGTLPSRFYQLSETRLTGNRSSNTPIDLLKDDSLFIIISFCRPVISDDNAVYSHQTLDGEVWNSERWWYRLIHVCRRWRRLVLDSASRLQVFLVCARGTPVAEMLAHAPPFPLIIDHIDEGYHVLTPEDEEGIKLALQQRDRVRRIRIRKSNSILKRLVVALDGEFPILEYLSIDDLPFRRPFINYMTNLDLPETFRAPHLHELVLDNFAAPIESLALTTMGNLVTLWLTSIPSSGYFYPDYLLQRLSLLPQLETLRIAFNCYNPSRGIEDIEGQYLQPNFKRVTLPSLHWLMFDGINTYLEALLPWATIPLLERLSVHFLNPMIYPIPHLEQLMTTARNLRLKSTTFIFREDYLHVMAYPHKGARLYTFFMELGNKRLDKQVESAAEFFHPLKTALSAVEDLTFVYDRHYASLADQARRSHWGELLGSFEKVKTLRVEDELVEQLSLALEHGERESQTELFPELKELSYPIIGVSRAREDPFSLFIDARRNAGRPVTLSYF